MLSAAAAAAAVKISCVSGSNSRSPQSQPYSPWSCCPAPGTRSHLRILTFLRGFQLCIVSLTLGLLMRGGVRGWGRGSVFVLVVCEGIVIVLTSVFLRQFIVSHHIPSHQAHVVRQHHYPL